MSTKCDLYRSSEVAFGTTANTHYWGPSSDPHQYFVDDDLTTGLSATSWKRGTCIPNFHKRKAAGELLPHTRFEKVEQETRKVPGGTFKGEYNFDILTETTQVHAYTPMSFDTLMNAVEESGKDYPQYIQAAAARIDGYGFDALTAIAEIKDFRRTWELISGKLFKAKKSLGDKFFDAWLGGRYGLRPIYYDIIDLNDALKKKLDKLSRYSERVGASQQWTDEADHGYYSIGYGVPAHWTIRSVTRFDISLRGSVTADVKINTFDFNPLQTAWEVIPYSFVVDWFSSVGQALSAASLVTSAKGIAASGGYKATVEVDYSWDDPVSTDSQYTITSWNKPTASAKLVVEQRFPSSVSITPFTTVNLDAWKAIDIIGLLRQIVR